MCERDDEVGGRVAGYVARVRDWMGRRDPTTEGLGGDDDPDSPETFKRWLRERDHTRDEVAGRPKCEQCGAVRKEDDGFLHRRWCSSCDLRWLEDIIAFPLSVRLGRKRARKALLALVKGEIGPTGPTK